MRENRMTKPQYDTAEEFEAYMAGLNQNQGQEHASRKNIQTWKTVPMIVGGFVLGAVLTFQLPSIMSAGDTETKIRFEEGRKTAVESLLSWFGADIEKFESKLVPDQKNGSYANFGN